MLSIKWRQPTLATEYSVSITEITYSSLNSKIKLVIYFFNPSLDPAVCCSSFLLIYPICQTTSKTWFPDWQTLILMFLILPASILWHNRHIILFVWFISYILLNSEFLILKKVMPFYFPYMCNVRINSINAVNTYYLVW